MDDFTAGILIENEKPNDLGFSLGTDYTHNWIHYFLTLLSSIRCNKDFHLVFVTHSLRIIGISTGKYSLYICVREALVML